MNNDVLRTLEFDGVRTLVARHAATSLGKTRARQLSPLESRSLVQEALAEVDEATALLSAGRSLPFGGIEDLAPYFRSIRDRGGPLEADELQRVARCLIGLESLRRVLASFADGTAPLLARGATRFGEFERLSDEIARCIDGGVVVDQASVKLSEIRREIQRLREVLRRRLEGILRSAEMRPHLQAPGFTIRNGRYVIQVRAQSRRQVRGVLHDHSQSGATVFIEPHAIVAEGNALSDSLDEERAEITRILQRLTRAVFDEERALMRSLAAAGHADLVWAKARSAKAFAWCPAEIPEDLQLHLKGARHPILVELAARSEEVPEEERLALALESVVPIDVHLGKPFRMLVITGPNTGGKTVVLKTVGLLVLMTKCGLPIPATAGSEVPFFGSVFADIGDEQSLQQSLSTFSSHMARISTVLAEAQSDSLVLLDELGSGTDPQEGGALGYAILEYLDRAGIFALGTTHLGSLKEFAYSHPAAENASVEFDAQTLQPTYRLLIGLPGTSNALYVARRMGLPESILSRAESSLVQEPSRTSELIDRMQASRQQIERARQEGEEFREAGRQLKESYQSELERVEERQRGLSDEADHEVEGLLRQVRAALLEHLNAIGTPPQPFADRLVELELAIEELVQWSPITQRRLEFARSLKKEDTVYLPRFGKKGRVKRIDRKGERLKVQVGAMVMEVPFEDVSWVEDVR